MEKNIFGKEYRLGILGGGQLGRMFIQEAINYNIDVHIMENDGNGRKSKEMNGDRSSKSPHKHQLQQMNVTNLIC